VQASGLDQTLPSGGSACGAAALGDIAAAARATTFSDDWAKVWLVRHPCLRWMQADGVVVRGRSQVLAMLESDPSVPPARRVETPRGADLPLGRIIVSLPDGHAERVSAGRRCNPCRVPERFTDMLKGGHPNSLGRTAQAVEAVLNDRGRLTELFAAITDPDEVVRLRVGDALEKVCREHPGWFVPHVDRLLSDLGQIEQPSVQWHVAQMLQHLRGDLSDDQVQQATALLQRNLSTTTDWIVLNVTMDVLTRWASRDTSLSDWLVPQLERLRRDERRSVAKRASQRLAELEQ
jgi:hypothetical protein